MKKRKVQEKKKIEKKSKEKILINETKKQDNSDFKVYRITIRYIILLCLMFCLSIIYKIFTPLTISPYVFLLKLFYSSIVQSNNIVIINFTTPIQIIPACIAGSAYLLLLILNLCVEIKPIKRILSIIFSFLLLLIINIVRLTLFSVLYLSNKSVFNFTHILFWYLLSTLFVIGIWFLTTKIFSIKEIPVYTDIKYIIERIKKKK